MSTGWGRFQGEGTGPDWLAPEDDGESRDAAPDWAAGASRGADGEAAASPAGWSAAARAAADSDAPAGWSAWAGPATASASASASSPAGRAAVPAPPDDEPPAWLDEPDHPDRSDQSDQNPPAPGGQSAPETPHHSFPKPERPSKSGGARKSTVGRSGFGEGGRGGSRASGGSRSQAAPKAAAKPAWQSRRKDRDPDAEPAEARPQSREKLEQRAKNILLHHLARQMQTRSQLADRLRKKEIPDDIAAAVLDRFEDLHLLDDAAYAETFVRSRHHERGLAKRALGYELRKRGVDDDTAEEALATLDEDREAETARRLVQGRLRATRNLDQQVRVRRLVGMLARKGYSSGVAMRAVKEALAEEAERPDGGLDPGIADALDDAGLE